MPSVTQREPGVEIVTLRYNFTVVRVAGTAVGSSLHSSRSPPKVNLVRCVSDFSDRTIHTNLTCVNFYLPGFDEGESEKLH